MNNLENDGLALLLGLLACMAILAVREVVDAAPVAEVERCRDWCADNGWQCDCQGRVG